MEKYDLSALYSGFESVEFQNDLKKIETDLETYKKYVDENLHDYDDFEEKLAYLLQFDQQFSLLVRKVSAFISLTRSADTTNEEANRYMAKLQMILSEATAPSTIAEKFIGKFEYLEEIADKDAFKEFKFYLLRTKENVKYLLSDEIETIISKLRQTGSSAWAQLQSLLTSKLDVEVTIKGETKVMTLPQAGNLTKNADPEIRKAAFEAVQKAYPKVEDAVAACLSSIKGEVNYTSKLRGFQSALDESLKVSKTKKETLDAMITAMYEYLPHFHKYLRRKAKLLGHEGALPIYDLLAPFGSVDKEYSIEEAQTFIVKHFRTFSDKLANLADKAFNENWIDIYPRKGKVGGAFCSNIPPIKQSRILTNFNGNLGDVVTLAHELGHAYHGENIFNENVLNSSYPMPVAETASTFCETIVMNAVINDSEGDEKLALIESVIQDYTAIICDILSRYIFENEVFEKRKEHPLSSKELQQIMRDAVKVSYGDGLDHNYVNPYAWLNKPHYYSSGLSFYNWPYAFGLLFAKGLYAQYLKDKESFVKSYDTLLASTGKMYVEDVAKLANIDVTKVEFWRSSLDLLVKDIDLFMELTENK